MEINRNQYFLIGLVLLFLGIAFNIGRYGRSDAGIHAISRRTDATPPGGGQRDDAVADAKRQARSEKDAFAHPNGWVGRSSPSAPC